MIAHTPTPWNAASAYSSVCGVPIVNQKGQRIGNTALPDMPKEWDELKERAVADAALIVTAVNNHAPMVKSLEHCAQLFDTLAQTIDRWATQSQTGGWSTHQIDENMKRANDCRRYAAQIRSALPRDLWDKQPRPVSTGRDAPVAADAKSCPQTQDIMGQQVEALHDALQQLVDWVKDGCSDEMRAYCMTEAQAALKNISLVRT